MKITDRTTIEVGTFEVNCTILTIDGKAWIVDPGSEPTLIAAQLKKKDLEPAGILLTHAHFDHVGAVNDLQRRYPALKVYIGKKDIPVLTHPFNQYPPDYPAISQPENLIGLSEGTPVEELNALRIIETPGHTPGGVCYFFPGSTTADGKPILLAGDTLFAGSAGRTDLPGGDMATLMASLQKLRSLPDETIVMPGHGMFSTIGDEKESNPFLRS